jgi:hypothetical protein
VKVTIRVKAIEWGDQFLKWSNGESVYPGVDGAVRYEMKFVRTPEEIAKIEAQGNVKCPNPLIFDGYFQPFSRKGSYQIGNQNIWAWDGNKEAPTLSPSFGIFQDDLGYRLHLYFQNGKINLCPDSTVTLEQ